MAIEESSDISIAARKASLTALVARKREAVRQETKNRREEEATGRDQWSGLMVAERCVRVEKVDASMRGKQIIPFSSFSQLVSSSRDQVVMAVLYSSPSHVKRGAKNEEYVEWDITDLNKDDLRQAKLTLVGNAMEHWARGAGCRQATLGSLFAILNPTFSGRAIRVSFETQLLKLGRCSSFGRCTAKNADGLECRKPYNIEKKEAGEYCTHHANISPCARQAHRPAMKHPRLLALEVHQKHGIALSSEMNGKDPDKHSVSTGLPKSQDLAAIENAEQILASTSSETEIINVLLGLEAQMDVTSLRLTGIYDCVGAFASRSDAAGAAARQLRRKWRALMEGPGGARDHPPTKCARMF